MFTNKNINQYILDDIFGDAWAGDSVGYLQQFEKRSSRHHYTPSLDQQAAVIQSPMTVRQVWTIVP